MNADLHYGDRLRVGQCCCLQTSSIDRIIQIGCGNYLGDLFCSPMVLVEDFVERARTTRGEHKRAAQQTNPWQKTDPVHSYSCLAGNGRQSVIGPAPAQCLIYRHDVEIPACLCLNACGRCLKKG